MSLTRRQYLVRGGRAGCGASLAGVAGCLNGERPAEPPATFRIGAKSFTEQELLGYLAFHRLATVTDAEIVDRIGDGDSLTMWNNAISGQIDLYWEYTGTAWTRLPPQRDEKITDSEQLFDQVAADARDSGLAMGRPAPFSNEYVLVTTREWSVHTGVSTISDLFTYSSTDDGPPHLALNEAFYHRRDGWGGLLDQYEVAEHTRERLDRERTTVTSIGLTYELLRAGDVAVANGFATDPQLADDTLVQLEDDRSFFSPYNPVPVAHASTATTHPAILESLEPVAASLDRQTMRQLNRAVIVDGRRASAVAEAHLDAEVR